MRQYLKRFLKDERAFALSSTAIAMAVGAFLIAGMAIYGETLSSKSATQEAKLTATVDAGQTATGTALDGLKECMADKSKC